MLVNSSRQNKTSAAAVFLLASSSVVENPTRRVWFFSTSGRSRIFIVIWAKKKKKRNKRKVNAADKLPLLSSLPFGSDSFEMTHLSFDLTESLSETNTLRPGVPGPLLCFVCCWVSACGCTNLPATPRHRSSPPWLWVALNHVAPLCGRKCVDLCVFLREPAPEARLAHAVVFLNFLN